MDGALRIFLAHNPEDREVYYGRALAHLKALGEVRFNPLDRDLTTAEFVEAAKGCQIIVSHRSPPAEAALFDGLPELMAYFRCALDVRTVDIAAASRNGVLVANAGISFIDATAEMALALMLAVCRDVVESTVEYRAGRVPPSNMGLQLAGSTAGVIGFGAVGSRLAEILVSLGMKVLVSDPFKTIDRPGMIQVDLDTLLRESDFVLPLAIANETTENLIGAREIALMKKGVVFVNVSRGNLIDEAALEAAYRSGHIAKLALDVGRAADQRPSPQLASLPGVAATPHLGGLTPANADAQAMSSVEQTRAVLAGRMPERALNADCAVRLKEFWKNRRP
ncbi:NAD(P)-dependent oxidoreductase [Shumkonia mesophila]|uniref:NAD(P)-dependent oxidoreductase n=1 Tax=Shumkonia mesophila TaxID=2838854 RepID=UPI002934F606|nr:NAD(P)-dependent oxidoreductase [Shumkonia mesophila]